MFLFFASLITGVVSARRPRIPRIPRPGRGHRNFIEYIPVQLDSDTDEYNDFEEDELEASNIKDYKPIRGYKSKSKYYTAKGKGAPTPKSIERKYTSLEYNDYNDFEEDEDLMIEMNGRGPRGLRPVRGVVSHEPITSHSKGFRSSIRFPFWIKMTPTPKPKSVVGKYTFLDYNDFE